MNRRHFLQVAAATVVGPTLSAQRRAPLAGTALDLPSQLNAIQELLRVANLQAQWFEEGTAKFKARLPPGSAAQVDDLPPGDYLAAAATLVAGIKDVATLLESKDIAALDLREAVRKPIRAFIPTAVGILEQHFPARQGNSRLDPSEAHRWLTHLRTMEQTTFTMVVNLSKTARPAGMDVARLTAEETSLAATSNDLHEAYRVAKTRARNVTPPWIRSRLVQASEDFGALHPVGGVLRTLVGEMDSTEPRRANGAEQVQDGILKLFRAEVTVDVWLLGVQAVLKG